MEKQFEGYGVVLSETIEGVQIVDLVKNGPAENSGQIKAGDLIFKINNKEISNYYFEDVLKLLKNHDEIVFGIKRDNDVISVRLKKSPISMDSDRLTYTYEKFDDGIIVNLKLDGFYDNGAGINSERDIKNALIDVRKHGYIKGVVLDLRENSGGFLSQAVRVASLFLKSGIIVISKYSNGEERYFRNVTTRVEYGGPLIVLTSKFSASASEIVAQCLKDYGRALIVGDERTFGKGSIQFQTITDKKADLFFKVTVGKYYTVSGKTTQVEGVIADIVVPSKYCHLNVGERYLEYSLKSDKISSFYKDPLLDLNGATKKWFQKNYLPSLQKVVSIYNKMLPTLIENSKRRLSADKQFAKLLKDKEHIYNEDVQIIEAMNILKDMIRLEREYKEAAEQKYREKTRSAA